MKKITKLTALALAFALILGMTAMAATTITASKDFATYADMASFNAANAVISYTDGTNTFDRIKFGNGFTFGEGSFAYNTTYYRSAVENPNWAYLTVVNVNGKNAIAPNAAKWYNGAQPPLQIGFTFPEAWEYNEEKALVVQMGVIPMDNQYVQNGEMKSTGISSNADAGFINGLITTDDGTVEKNVIAKFSGMIINHPTVHGHANMYLVPIGQTIQGNCATTYGDVARWMEESWLTTVIRPYDHNDESVTSPEDASLNIINNINRGWGRLIYSNSNTYARTTYHMVGDTPITKVHGLAYSNQNYAQFAWTGYRMFEVSLDPADFTITSAKTFENVEYDDEITIEFSQPISTSMGYAAGVNTQGIGDQLLSSIKVRPANGSDLVYGEDYTIEVVEKSSGNTIWDAIVIKPVGAWEFGKEYTVYIPDRIKNIARVTMIDNYEDSWVTDQIEFTVEKAPTFTMDLKAYAGLSATGTELSAVSTGTTYFVISAAYSEGKVMANGTLRLEVKDAEGNLVKYVTAKKALGTGTASFGVALRTEAGQKVYASIDGGVIGAASIE